VVGDDSLTQNHRRDPARARRSRAPSSLHSRSPRLQVAAERDLSSGASPKLVDRRASDNPADAEPNSVHCANALTAELTARAGVGLPDAKVVARETVSAMGMVPTLVLWHVNSGCNRYSAATCVQLPAAGHSCFRWSMASPVLGVGHIGLRLRMLPCLSR
jgi:hypothetical protein